jgi:hypothetical protein
MGKTALVYRYSRIAIEKIDNIRFLKKKMKKLGNELSDMSHNVFKLRNKISTHMRYLNE